MRQSEKLLVYVVTGFLFVILAVAVMFGKDGAARPTSPPDTVRTGNATMSLEEVLRGQGQELAGQEQEGSEESRPPVVEEKPLVANKQLAPPTAAEEVAMVLGPSSRERDWRVVKVRPGDTLRDLVLRWCGSLEEYLPLTERLNERGTMLHLGHDVFLPWVDDAAVLVAFRDRLERRTPPPDQPLALTRIQPEAVPATDGGGAPRPVPAVALAFRVYTVKSGDMLWKIAEREVGRRGAPGFIRQVRELNPNLDVDSLRVGQEIKLPSKA